MDFLISASTDVGIAKMTNQDSYTIKQVDTPLGKCVLAVLCDGMGGLAKGELASATVVKAFGEWLVRDFGLLFGDGFDQQALRDQWIDLIDRLNLDIREYGERHGTNLGTTVCALLLLQDRYYVLNVGDSRAYEIQDGLYQITEDQTVVAREVRFGNLTPEEAETDARRNILLQCVGASAVVHPQIHTGPALPGATYLLCSDGFRHMVSPDEIYAAFRPAALAGREDMENNSKYMIELNKSRQERDNITVLLARTF